ncbi:Renal dipeptidase [Paenibacillus pectinilyticus]|uniref:Renal dipeptidase n=1 Tax=Paenibacillus pectinilyticus TaxID=512399 RepID=A0A1C0ZSJ9_9BACL|nr:nucleotidyltransferase family protein [Paenibacillus pectinilyticus]OCT11052.1 Renal dipeptidase [Paenibacillus pectinilyticus]
MDIDFDLNVTQFSKELKVLFLFLKSGESVGDVPELDQDWLVDFDWDKFLKLTLHHRVYPELYRKLQTMKTAWVPSHMMDTLRKHYHNNAFQMLHLSAEMEQLSKSFATQMIRSLVLKGPVLAADLYGDISLRTSRDLDILVPIDDLDRVDDLLSKLNYEKIEYPLTVLNDWKWRHHHITYYHADKRVTVEIHWRLGPGPAKEPSFNELWERRRLSTITSSPVHYLGKEDLFSFLASHGARHGWSRLRWLVDIDQIVKQNLDASVLIKQLKKHDNLHVGAQALVLTTQLLQTTLPSELNVLTTGSRARRLAQGAIFYIRQMVNLHTDPVPEDVSKYHKRHLFSLMSNWNKVLFVLSFMYPYPEDVETLPLPKYAQFLYFPLRPFLWAWRRAKKQTAAT